MTLEMWLSVWIITSQGYFIIIFFKFSFKFTYLGGGRDREQERERIPNRLRAVSAEHDAGLDPRNHEIMTQVEIKSQMLN